MGGCGSSLRAPHEKRFRRAIKLYEVSEVRSLTNLLNRNKCFESGEIPLTLAASEGHEAVVNVLLKHGADANKLDRNGRAPLHIAVYINDEETVDILLGHKANPNRYDEHNMTPLHIACERGYSSMVKKLFRAGARVNENQRGVPPLILAVVNGHADCVNLLLQCGADPDVCDGRGNTALHVAVSRSNVECVKTLLDHEADVYAASRDNGSLLSLAALNGCPGTVQALLDAGCDPNCYTDEDVPALIAATGRGCSDCVDALLEAGARVDIRDKKNHTPLFNAVAAAVDTERDIFYCKYFSNVYRNHSKYDPLEIFPENVIKCAMGLVQAGADVTKAWDRFALVFPSAHGVTFEQMVLCEVLVQAYGFRDIAKSRLRTLVLNLLRLREYGLVKLLYSAGVNPESDDLFILSPHNDSMDKNMLKYAKGLRYSPRQLKDICRKKIRHILSWNILFLVEKLEVPLSMKEYICITDTEHYSRVEGCS